jgi:translation initiation factor 4E
LYHLLTLFCFTYNSQCRGISDEQQQQQQAYTTVLADPVNFNVKHPLHSGWTLWYDNSSLTKRNTSAQSWEQNLKELVTFDTVEDFWCVFNNIAKPHELPAGANYHLFKIGVRPMWEDAANVAGGKWVLQIPQKPPVPEMDDYWLYTILACIGEAFEDENEICGAVVSIRKAFVRLALWTRNCTPREVLENVGRQFKSYSGYGGRIEFQPHSEALKGGSSVKSKYVL